ncbi:MAG: hypothetical protein NC078_03755 [Ruminococcus sp.]|nr:hypothetical protein [Ruminococcus sp.]
MKNISFYPAPKYGTADYTEAEPHIYRIEEDGEEFYVTSLVFEQEPEYGENAPDSPYISQYPLEDILDYFCCWCRDFYESENEGDPVNSYQELVADEPEPLREVLDLCGKHVYTKDGRLVME